MINAIIYGISNALHEEFGDACEIHMETMKQGLKEPCFFISCLNPTTKLFPGKCYYNQNQFCIQYFPATEQPNKECNETAEQLRWCLEYIETDSGKTHGTEMRHEVIDGVLNFFVNYNMFIRKIESTTQMEEVTISMNAKG